MRINWNSRTDYIKCSYIQKGVCANLWHSRSATKELLDRHLQLSCWMQHELLMHLQNTFWYWYSTWMYSRRTLFTYLVMPYNLLTSFQPAHVHIALKNDLTTSLHDYHTKHYQTYSKHTCNSLIYLSSPPDPIGLCNYWTMYVKW